jgi:hypothetical protein
MARERLRRLEVALVASSPIAAIAAIAPIASPPSSSTVPTRRMTIGTHSSAP